MPHLSPQVFSEATLLPKVAPLIRDVFATTVARATDATYCAMGFGSERPIHAENNGMPAIAE